MAGAVSSIVYKYFLVSDSLIGASQENSTRKARYTLESVISITFALSCPDPTPGMAGPP